MSHIEEFLSELTQLDVQLWLDDEKLRCNAPDNVLTPELRSRLAERKPELIAFLKKAGQAASASPPDLVRVPRDQNMPLSHGQERLWALAEMRPESSVYNISTAFLLKGKLDMPALEKSLTELQRRHEILRTRFPADDLQKPRQSIAEPVPVVLSISNAEKDLHDMSAERHDQEVRRFLQAEAWQPFDLKTGPLWRASLLKFGRKKIYVLSFTMHHIIFDGSSKAVFLNELTAFYKAFASNKLPEIEELPIQYADFACWQRERLTGDMEKRQLAYWKKQFDTPATALCLPNDNPRSAAAFSGVSQSFVFPDKMARALGELSRQEKCSLFMVLLSAFNLLLYRYSNQEDQLICAPLASRDRSELEGLIGYFNNIVVIRSDLSADPSFRELMARVRRTVIDAFDNQNLPLQKLAELPNLVRVPLTRCMFSYSDTSSRTLDLPKLSATSIDIRKDEGDFEVAMYMESAASGNLSGVLEYNAELFNTDTIARLISDFETLLEHLVSNPDQRLSEGPSRLNQGLREVEAKLNDHPQIDQAVVVALPDHSGSTAYLVLNEDDVPAFDDIRSFVQAAFPDYLVPVSFVPLDTLPLLADGTIDYQSLPTPNPGHEDRRAAYVAPRTDTERQLAEIWKKVLWLDQDVSVEDSFTDLGGHSLLSVQLVLEIEKQLKHGLPAHVIAKLSTVEEMAKALDQKGTSPSEGESALPEITDKSAGPRHISHELYQGLLSYTGSWEGHRTTPESLIVGLNTEGTKRTLFWCLQRYFELTQLAKYLGPDQPIFGMRSGNKVMIKTQKNINALAAHYADEILTTQPEGPFVVGGNCQAAQIAFQVAARLQKLGHEVALLILMEQVPPFPYPGRVAILYGKDCDRNPYRQFKEPEFGWKKYYSGELSFDFLQGGHGEFFKEPNVQVLTQIIGKKIGEASAQTEAGTSGPARGEFQLLPNNAYRAKLSARDSWTVEPGAAFTVPVKITNTSPVAWKPASISGISLVNRWVNTRKKVLITLDGRAKLDTGLEPNATVELNLTATAPLKPGRYFMELDLADEGITWFNKKGSASTLLSVNVAASNGLRTLFLKIWRGIQSINGGCTCSKK